ncbi:MAG: hypothetical protein GY822_20930, partial [Deltaproteobacteria bacterium]|nr:hypothetical protein [Deltaproteobacteria bacterium]
MWGTRPSCGAEEEEEEEEGDGDDDDVNLKKKKEEPAAPQCDEEPIPSLEDAPFALSCIVAQRFLLPPPMQPGSQATEDACIHGSVPSQSGLISLVGARARKEVEVVCTDAAREENDDGVVRFAPRFTGHLVDALAKRALDENEKGATISSVGEDKCMSASEGIPCSRIRFSNPTTQLFCDARPILPVSLLASCQNKGAEDLRKWVDGRIVILQLSSFFSDLHTTPMTIGWLSDQRFAPGSQIIADAVETVLHDDAPRAPPLWMVALFLALSASLGVWAGAFLRPQLALFVPVFAPLLLLAGGMFTASKGQLWLVPTSAPFVAAVFGVSASFLLHFTFSTRVNELTARYLPPPVRHLLLQRRGSLFEKQDRYAVVLMTDLVGYTTVTGILGSARAVISFINTYFDATMPKVQDTHHGWLEDYVGDLACFFGRQKHCSPSTSKRCAPAERHSTWLSIKKFF